jgi:hypothetical protein
MLPFIFVSTATGFMGTPQYIRLCQEHFAELFLSIIVIAEGEKAFRRIFEYVSDSVQLSLCIQHHAIVTVISVLHQSRRVHLLVVQSLSTFAANDARENACLKSQFTHILNPESWMEWLCFCLLLLLPLRLVEVMLVCGGETGTYNIRCFTVFAKYYVSISRVSAFLVYTFSTYVLTWWDEFPPNFLNCYVLHQHIFGYSKNPSNHQLI